MKKQMIKITAGLLLTGLIIGLSVMWADAGADKTVAIVLKSVGEVQVKGAKGWTNVNKGSKLLSGDQIQTKKTVSPP